MGLLGRSALSLAAAALFLASCGGDTDRTDSADPVDSFDLFPVELREDLANLQEAINLRLEADVEECITAEGWRFIPEEHLAAPESYPGPVFTYLQSFQARGTERSQYIASLSESESRAYEAVRRDCVLNSEWNVDHPLAAEGNLLSRLETEASSRAAASDEFLNAENDYRDCVGDAGLSELEALHVEVARRASEIDDEHRFGRLDSDEALAQLIALDDQWQNHAALVSDCERKRTERRRLIYDRELHAIAIGHPELPFLVGEVRAKLRLYSPELEGLRGD